MKTNILKYGRTVLYILVIFLVLYIPLKHIYSNENKISYSASNSDSNKFMVGIINNGIEDSGRYYLLTDSLLCNTWHRYGMWKRGPNWFQGDSLYADINVYKNEIQNVIDDNRNHNMRTLFMREKLLYLCSGQRSDYQCEETNFDNDLLPYTFKTHNTGGDFRDNSSFGNNNWVRYCSTIPSYGHNAGYVCRELRANREQINIHSNWGEYAVDRQYKWYVKPRIRIDTAYANNPINFYNNICRIEVLNFVGDTILNKDLLVSDFRGDLDSIYHGNYKESFERNNLNILEIDTNKKFNPTNAVLWDSTGKVDFRVYWYGQCNMWIDYVRVDNETAHKLFQGFYDNFWLDWEVYQIARPNVDIIDRIYIEEFEFNQIPCMKYVSDYIKSVNSNFSLMFDLNISTYSIHKEDFGNFYEASHIKKFLYDPIQPKEVFSYSYPLKARYVNEYGNPDGNHYIPYTLPGDTLEFNPLKEILAIPTSPGNYDNYLNNLLEVGIGTEQSNRTTMKTLDELSKTTNLPIIFMPQGHLVYWQYHQLKEPTNEELALLTYLGLTYGAKGILHYSYNGYGCPVYKAIDSLKDGYDRGFYNPEVDSCKRFGFPRYKNAYGQLKWQNVKEINKHLLKWGDYLLRFNIATRESFSYEIETDRSQFKSNTYFNDILTYKPSVNSTACTEITPDSTETRTSIVQECENDRYLQISKYDITNESFNKYFMVVNRRCSPFVDESSQDNNGGRRLVKVKFDQSPSSFNGFNNWAIIDLYKDSLVKVFNKSNSGFLDLGWFMPAEARLYKIAPVIQEGGTFVCDEYVNTNFTCNGMVYGNGHNITINQGKTISFSEDGGLYMEGGCFVSGINSDNADAVTFQGTGGANHWKGITLNGCDSVGIYNTITSNAESNDTPKTYSYSIINSYKVDFRKCNFITENDRGIIQAVYNGSSLLRSSFKVRESNFYMENCGYPAINVISNASASIPLIAEWCTFHSKDNDTSCAIMLTGVTGGAVKNCYFYDFGKTIIFISSSIDLYGNLILGGNNSEGLQCLSGSSVSLGPNSGMYLGGYNYFRNYGTTSSNIRTDDSFFDIDCGNNEFDIDETDYSKHLTGTMESDDEPASVNAYKNCFHEDSITNIEAIHDVIWSDTNSNVNFLFEPYFCDLTQLQDFVVFEAYGFPDTVYYKSGGEGGGFNPNKTINAEENTYKSLKDTVDINLRKRNYQTVETNSKLILTQYPDSLESIGMVQKLYMASLNLDSTRIGITKTFLENLISNNTQNPSLIKRAFYFIQKCKVKLGQFQSALEGFQYIMTQNPYTYEGLVASWDYAATYLLMGTGGSIQGDNEQKLEDLTTPTDTLLSRMSKRDINTNRNSNNSANEKITKIFYEKIKNTTKDDRSKQEEKVKTLEKTLESSKSTPEKNEAARELAVMKQIKEAVKIKKPKTVINHVQIMNDDIKKVFGVGKKSSKESMNSLIPQTYQLYQNYPNPFNPTTKIAFDLPKDAKVKLVIYDILGREMKTLVNNEFRSVGKYITEFNGSNMASGVYFARILVNEGKDFIAVKKMVYLK